MWLFLFSFAVLLESALSRHLQRCSCMAFSLHLFIQTLGCEEDRPTPAALAADPGKSRRQRCNIDTRAALGKAMQRAAAQMQRKRRSPKEDAGLAAKGSFLCRGRAAGHTHHRQSPRIPVSCATSALKGPGVPAMQATAEPQHPGTQHRCAPVTQYRHFMQQHLQLAHRTAACQKVHFKAALALWRLQSVDQPQCTTSSRKRKRSMRAQKNADPKAAAQAAEAAKEARMNNLKKAWEKRAKERNSTGVPV